MKKILPSLLIITAIIGLIISCQKKSDVNMPDLKDITAQKLSMNSDFNKYSDNFNALIDSTLKHFDKSQLDVLISKIEMAKTQNLTIEEQYTFLTKEIKFSDEKTLKRAAKIILPSYKSLQAHFKNGLTEDVFEKATKIKNVRDVQIKFISRQQTPEVPAVAAPSGWRYSLCSASVTFQGGLLLAACEAASAGVATPLCLAGAVAFAADGIAGCADKYL